MPGGLPTPNPFVTQSLSHSVTQSCSHSDSRQTCFAFGELLGTPPSQTQEQPRGSALGWALTSSGFPHSGAAPWACVERTSLSRRSPGILPVDPLRVAYTRPAPKSRLAVSVRPRPRIKSQIKSDTFDRSNAQRGNAVCDAPRRLGSGVSQNQGVLCLRPRPPTNLTAPRPSKPTHNRVTTR